MNMMNEGIKYVDYLINKTEEMTRKLGESSDSEGICADIGYSNPSRGSMTSSINNNDRMFLSTMSTPTRQASRIPALMTKSLHAPRSMSIPQRGPSNYGSGEQLCQDYDGFRGYYNSRRQYETEMLLSRSQEKRQLRASSYDPRCLIPLHPTSSLRLSTSATASTSNHLSLSTSSSIHTSGSYSKLLPKRPQWIRSQPSSQIQLAESTVSMVSFETEKCGFYLDSDEDSVDSEQETPRRRPKQVSIRKLKDRNRKRFRNSIRRLHPPPSSPTNLQYPPSSNFSSFLCVSSPIFYLLIAFLFRILLFFSDHFL